MKREMKMKEMGAAIDESGAFLGVLDLGLQRNEEEGEGGFH